MAIQTRIEAILNDWNTFQVLLDCDSSSENIRLNDSFITYDRIPKIETKNIRKPKMHLTICVRST